MKKKYGNNVLIGERFNSLIIIEIDESLASGHDMAWCNCDCGGSVRARKSDVIRGHTTSCGYCKKKQKIDAKKKEGTIWNPVRRKFGAYTNGKLLGHFYEEAVAEMVVKKANRRAA